MTDINPYNSNDSAVMEGSFRRRRISTERCLVRGKGGERHHGPCKVPVGQLCLCFFLGASLGTVAGTGWGGRAQLSEVSLPSLPWKGGGNCSANGVGRRVGAGASSFSAAAHPPWSMMLVHHCRDPSPVMCEGNICSHGCRALQS